MTAPVRLAILTSHPIQYYSPLFRELARRLDVHVFFAHKASPAQQAQAGFGEAFEWDIDLTSGFAHSFLENIAQVPDTSRFDGCDTPEIARRLREGRFDAVLTLGWYLKSFHQGIWAAKRLGIPVLVRGDSQLGTPQNPIKRFVKAAAYPGLLRLFDAALYVGVRNREYYEHYRYPRARLFHSPHCVDTQHFAGLATPSARAELRSRLGIREQDRLVLFAGKLVPFKRPLDVIEAVACLRNAGAPVQVLVAGAGPLAAGMTARAAALQVPLHMLGFQNQTAMPAAYAAADVLVLPSSGRETWGLVCNEALACGTPIVVSSEVGCAPDLVGDGTVGRVFPVGNVPLLADAINAALQLPRNSAKIANVSDRHSLGNASDGIENAVRAVMKRSGTGGGSGG